MAQKIRKQIYIDPGQEQKLIRLSEKTGASQAEIIRTAIDSIFSVSEKFTRDIRAWDTERAFIQQLMAKDPVKGPRSWTREELHER
jgi:predicted DNA-binding protein